MSATQGHSDRLKEVETTLANIKREMEMHFEQEERERGRILESLDLNTDDHKAISTTLQSLSVNQATMNERISMLSRIMWAFLLAAIGALVAGVYDMLFSGPN